MDERHQTTSAPPDGPEEPRVVLVVCPAGHAVGEAVLAALRDAGCRAERPADVYQATVEVARRPGRAAAVVLAVDFFNREELRFFPMAKRRWPGLRTAAMTRPAFAYKAAVADLAGADAWCTEAARAAELVARLGLAAGLPEGEGHAPRAVSPAPIPAEPAAAPLTAIERPAPPRPGAGVAELVAGMASTPSEGRPPAQPPPSRPESRRREPRRGEAPPGEPAAQPPAPKWARDILTEEEIQALMQDFGEDLRKDDASDE